MIRALLDDFLNATVIFGYDRIGFAVRRGLWDAAETRADMTGKVCLVTGANSGLGKATAMHLAKLGASVHMLCRNPELGEAARREIVAESGADRTLLHLVDMGEPEAVRAFAEDFRRENQRLDVLVNNAGVLLAERVENSLGMEMTFAVNTLGYFLTMACLAPLLRSTAGARVINVSSGGMYLARLQVDDPHFKKRAFNGTLAYAESKRAEVALAQLWSEQFAPDGVFVSAMHPGWADTKAVRNSLPTFFAVTRPFLRRPEQGADTIIWLAVNPRLSMKDTGRFWFDRKARPVYRKKGTRHEPEDERRLWNMCAEHCGMPPLLEER